MKKFSFKILILLTLTFVCNSCSFFSPDPKEFKSDKYTAKMNDKSWRSVDPDISDMAFVHNQTGSIILTNSLCKKYHSASLDTLTQGMLSGIKDLNVNSNKVFRFQGRDAARTEAIGKIDGVSVSVDLVTLKKDGCTYDFVLISSGQVSESEKKVFDSFLESIKFQE